jgi:hypothetical protein
MLAEEVSTLRGLKFLKENSKNFKGNIGHYYELTAEGKGEAKKIIIKMDKKDLESFKQFCRKYNEYTPSELLKLVYIKYPEWTVNSKLLQ